MPNPNFDNRAGNGAMSELDISNNKITRGKLEDGAPGNHDSHHEADMSGVATLSGVLEK